MSHLNRRAMLGALAVAPWMAPYSRAQGNWPSRTIRLVVPYPAGGAPDIFTRTLGEQLAIGLKAIVIVDAKPGASGLLGMRAVSQGPADGHTFAYTSSGQVTLTAMNPKFDLLKELKPVVRLSASPFVLLVRADSPYKTVRDLVKAVQAQPGQLSYGTAGPGSPAHMAVAYLEEAIKDFNALHVPFKGAVESINAMLGGQIVFTIAVLGAAAPHIKGGKLRALGVTPAKRVALFPDVPTIAEATGTDYAYESWGGFTVHADTPDEVIAQAAKAFVTAAQSDSVGKYLANTGGRLALMPSPAEFGKALAREVELERRVVKRLGITQS